MTPFLAFVVVAGLLPESVASGVAGTDDVILELVKTVGIIVSAVAAMYCARIAAVNRRTTRRVERKVDRKRERVRKTDAPDGVKVIIEEGDRKRRNDD